MDRRERYARLILDGWSEGNETWEAASDMTRLRCFFAADAILAKYPFSFSRARDTVTRVLEHAHGEKPACICAAQHGIHAAYCLAQD